MKTKIGVFLVLAVLIGACGAPLTWEPGPAPTPEPGPDFQATALALEALLTEQAAVAEPTATATALPATLPPPEAAFTPTPTPTPTTIPVACGVRPPNGTLIRIMTPTTSRACPDSRCENQGQVVVGSVRPLEWMDFDEDTGEAILRFTYLPIEGQDYNLLEYKKKDGEWQWVLLYQFIRGEEGVEFECVEATD
jgi:hypothetical protein